MSLFLVKIMREIVQIYFKVPTVESRGPTFLKMISHCYTIKGKTFVKFKAWIQCFTGAQQQVNKGDRIFFQTMTSPGGKELLQPRLWPLSAHVTSVTSVNKTKSNVPSRQLHRAAAGSVIKPFFASDITQLWNVDLGK